MSKDKPIGWICPNCGIAYAPWVMSCECEKEFPSDPVRITHWPAMEKLCQDLDQARDQPPLVTESDHDDFYLPGGVVNLRANLQTLSHDNAALLDLLMRWRDVCQQACGGSEELCAAVDDRCVKVHDEAVNEERQQQTASADIKMPALEEWTQEVIIESVEDWDVPEVVESEGDSPPRTLRFEVKSMQTLEAEILQHQQDTAIAELQAAQENIEALDVGPEVKAFLRKHPWGVTHLRKPDRLASTEEDAERQQPEVPSRKTDYE